MINTTITTKLKYTRLVNKLILNKYIRLKKTSIKDLSTVFKFINRIAIDDFDNNNNQIGIKPNYNEFWNVKNKIGRSLLMEDLQRITKYNASEIITTINENYLNEKYGIPHIEFYTKEYV